MKVIITGSEGQLGKEIYLKLIENPNLEVLGLSHKDIDIRETNRTKECFFKFNPNIVIHCAAWTAVDKAESYVNDCIDVNCLGTKNIANICKLLGAKLIFFSTDYIFDGSGNDEWTIGSEPAPINIYGYTKLYGENIIKKILTNYFIVRISWVYGKFGNNFVNTIINLSKTKNEIYVVDDQIGNPTYTLDIANFVVLLLNSVNYGTYHFTNMGEPISWYDFAKEICDYNELPAKIIPITTDEYDFKAKRPLNSRLNKLNLYNIEGYNEIPNWKTSLHYFLDEIRRNNN